MKFFVSILLLISLNVSAQNKCLALFGTFSWVDYRQQSDAIFKKVLHGDESKNEQELYFYWHTANPSTLTKINESTYAYTYSNKRMVNYSNHPDQAAATPLQALGTMMGRQQITNAEILHEFIKNYDVKAPADVIEEIKYIESQIPDQRQSFGYIATAPAQYGGKLIGTYRVYNGTAAHSQSKPDLPSERSFAYRKIRTKTSDFLKHTRESNPHLPIFELGKFSLLGTAEMRDRGRQLIELFWLRYFIDNAPPEAIFVAHVDSKAHRRLYESRYGFKMFEQIITPGQSTNEFILMVTAADIRIAFNKLYPISKPDITIVTP